LIEFRKDAVRIALPCGLSRKQIADDLGVGMSTLNKWITAHPQTGNGCNANHERGDTDVVSADQRAWIEQYKRREAVGQEYYYVVERHDSSEFQHLAQEHRPGVAGQAICSAFDPQRPAETRND
jgi:transposase